MTEKFTAKTVDEAKALAAKKFGKSISEIKFEILDEGKKGILGLGLGAKDAVVKATYVPPVSASKPVAAAPAEKKEIAAVTAAPVSEKPVVTTETTAEPVKASAPVKETAPDAEDEMEEAGYSLDNFTLIEDEALINPKVKLARDYITSILRAMDVDAQFTVYQRYAGAAGFAGQPQHHRKRLY